MIIVDCKDEQDIVESD